jgi:hypothetical protein
VSFAQNRKESRSGSGYPNLDEVSDIVLNDYQNYLMNKWIEELKGRYKVQINKKILSSVY